MTANKFNKIKKKKIHNKFFKNLTPAKFLKDSHKIYIFFKEKKYLCFAKKIIFLVQILKIFVLFNAPQIVETNAFIKNGILEKTVI